MAETSGPDTMTVLDNDMWRPFLAIARTPARVVPDRAEGDWPAADHLIRELLYRYAYFYDAGDLDGVMSVFAADATVMNNRGTYVGTDAIRENYAYLIGSRRFGFHQISNTMVRLAPDGREAVATSYLFCVNLLHTGALIAINATYADRVVRRDETWQFLERRIAAHFQSSLPAVPMTGPAGTPPVGAGEGLRERLGDAWIL